MKITMLGTGNAAVTKCYNTCFVLEENGNYFLVDGGGGNGLFTQLMRAGLDWKRTNEIFVTHKHLDHIMGVVWMLRMFSQAMKRGEYDGEAIIYGHEEVLSILENMAQMLLPQKQARLIGDKIHLIEVKDKEEREILGRQMRFFDIGSTKAKQYGFCMKLDGGEKLTCCGDEPYRECEREYAEGSKWLLHEAFCLASQAERFKPYEKHHSTVADACRMAQQLEVQNLVLYHTEDANIDRRKELYCAEGKPLFAGNLFVPDDLESLEL
jgi:ribonuclease Z